MRSRLSLYHTRSRSFMTLSRWSAAMRLLGVHIHRLHHLRKLSIRQCAIPTEETKARNLEQSSSLRCRLLPRTAAATQIFQPKERSTTPAEHPRFGRTYHSPIQSDLIGINLSRKPPLACRGPPSRGRKAFVPLLRFHCTKTASSPPENSWTLRAQGFRHRVAFDVRARIRGSGGELTFSARGARNVASTRGARLQVGTEGSNAD